MLSSAKQFELDELTKQYKVALTELITNPPAKLEPKVSNNLLLYGTPFLYLKDNLKEGRWMINHCSKLFQEYYTGTAIPPTLPPKEQDRLNPNLPQRKLKIGYIGHTFRKHSVGWLCRWLFVYHNREAFEIYLYLIHQNKEDELTEAYFTNNVDRTYRFSIEPEATAAQIRQDEVDILIDLDSFTRVTTCQVLAHKPAPIQVSWLGMDTTGLPTIDYFIADAYVLPENAQEYYREKIWRLPQTYLAIDGFEIGTPTMRREQLDISTDAVIYLNNQGFKKLNPSILRLQMRILKAVPHSYLLFKGQFICAEEEKEIKILLGRISEEAQLDFARLRFLERDTDELTHRANLQLCDVALDTYPYSGATTTLELLWLGIPIVTRVGEQFSARNSYAFMTHAGLTEGIAWTDEDYVEWGIRFGRDKTLRETVSLKLKASRQTSPLWKAKQFTQEMEKAYQQMWAQYLEQNSTPSIPSIHQ
ncbi:MAG: hypothetical protein HC890_17305 [Chloroflexaceae bacterium]|nr:hypothetical protein [Chloroflexaceae bacterium]